MSKKFLTPIDLNGLEIQNVKFQNLGTSPGSPGPGLVYFDTVIGCVRVHNGLEWINLDVTKIPDGTIPLLKLAVNPLARANHTGTQAASTIIDLATVVKAYRLDEFAAPNTSVNFNGQRLTGLGNAVSPSDALTLSQGQSLVDAAVLGIDSKPSVKVVAVANITLTGTQTIDGVTLAVGDRVLLTAQTTASQNGTYVVASGAWSRPTDVKDNITSGAFWYVEEGTVYGASQWRCINNGVINVGTSSITITQFGSQVNYTASSGIQKIGSNFSIQLQASSGLTINGSGIAVDPTVYSKHFATTIGDGSSTAITVTHNLNTQDVLMQVRDISTNNVVECDIKATSATTSTFTFAVAPAINSYRVVIVG